MVVNVKHENDLSILDENMIRMEYTNAYIGQENNKEMPIMVYPINDDEYNTAHRHGYKKGYTRGYDDGYEHGHDAGYAKGLYSGMLVGVISLITSITIMASSRRA